MTRIPSTKAEIDAAFASIEEKQNALAAIRAVKVVPVSKHAHDAAMTSGCAPDGHRFMVMATNGDGRPCAWATSKILAHATAAADDLWSQHGHGDGCYPGEERDENEVKIIPWDESAK